MYFEFYLNNIYACTNNKYKYTTLITLALIILNVCIIIKLFKSK